MPGHVEGADLRGHHPVLGGFCGLEKAERQPVFVQARQARPERWAVFICVCFFHPRVKPPLAVLEFKAFLFFSFWGHALARGKDVQFPARF